MNDNNSSNNNYPSKKLPGQPTVASSGKPVEKTRIIKGVGPSKSAPSSTTKNSSQKNSSNEVNPDEWTFDVKVETNQNGDVQEIRTPTPKKTKSTSQTLELEEREPNSSGKNRNELSLVEDRREVLTRAQMAEKLEQKIKKTDIINYADPIKRLLAQCLDCIGVVLLFYVVNTLRIPFYHVFMNLINYFKISIELTLVEYQYFSFYILAFSVYFFYFVVITAFYNQTLGKKFLSIRVREEQRFSLAISDMFMREMIYKPVSFLSVVGLLMSFSHKKRRCLHDVMSRTIVIED